MTIAEFQRRMRLVQEFAEDQGIRLSSYDFTMLATVDARFYHSAKARCSEILPVRKGKPCR